MRPSVVVRAAAKNLPSVAIDAHRDLIDFEGLLADQFGEAGESPLRSAELAEQWVGRMHSEVESVLNAWSAIGVPPPAVCIGGVRCVTLRHPRYPALAPQGGLPPDYPLWLALVEQADPKQFTLAVCAWLAVVGCSEIYVIDGANDLGVDCVGLIREGPLRSVCILCQAKTASAAISVATVRGDYQKYLEGFWSSTVASRLTQAMSLRDSREGFVAPFVFHSNNEYGSPCGEYARRHRVLLRNRRQLAYSLARAFSLTALEDLFNTRASQVRRSFDFNWAPVIAMARAG